MQFYGVSESEIVAVLGVLGEDVLELLRYEASLGVVGSTVAAVLVLVDVLNEDAEERVRQPPRHGGIGEVGVDDEDGKKAE